MTRGGRAPTARYVEHVMGMPISLALRGRHADDDARAGRLGRGDGRRCARSTGSSAPTGGLGRLPARPRRDRRRGLPAGGRRGAGARRARPERAVRRRLRRPAARARRPAGARPERRGQGLGRRARRGGRCARCQDTDFCLSAGGDLVCRTLDPDGAALADRHRGPADPRRILAVVPVFTGAVATSGTAHRGQHLVDARTGRPPTGVASVTVVAGVADLGRHRRDRRLRAGPRRRRLAGDPAAAAPAWWSGPTGRRRPCEPVLPV